MFDHDAEDLPGREHSISSIEIYKSPNCGERIATRYVTKMDRKEAYRFVPSLLIGSYAAGLLCFHRLMAEKLPACRSWGHVPLCAFIKRMEQPEDLGQNEYDGFPLQPEFYITDVLIKVTLVAVKKSIVTAMLMR